MHSLFTYSNKPIKRLFLSLRNHTSLAKENVTKSLGR